MKKFIPCRNCYGKNGNVAPEGYISTWVDGQNGSKIETVTECSCHVKWRLDTKVESKAKKANLNIKWINFNPDTDYVGEKSLDSVNRIKSFVSKVISKDTPVSTKSAILSTSIYMFGRNGTQKTTIANYVGYEFLRNGKSVYYCLMNDLVKLLQEADRNPEVQEKLDYISKVDLLIIDEAFDIEKMTIYRSEFQIPFLDTFLRNRLQTNNKGILFVSNVSIEDIDKPQSKREFAFNKSISDLVQRNVPSYCRLTFDDKFEEEKSKLNEEELF